MKVRTLKRGRVVDTDVDAVLVLDDDGRTIMVAGQDRDKTVWMAHFQDPDFRQILDALGFDSRACLCPSVDVVSVAQNGRISVTPAP